MCRKGVRITYSREGRKEFLLMIKELACQGEVQKVCEIGAGANPCLSMEFVKDQKLEYTILDASYEELEKASDGYKKIQADIASRDFSIPNECTSYDLVFSKMLAEHISNPRLFHINTLNMLSPNGLAIHFFPTLYALPFLVNCMLSERVASNLLDFFAPRDKYWHQKFPAYYRWCRGPLKSQIRRFEKLGYEVLEYRGFFGHAGYYKKLPFLRMIHEILIRVLIKHPVPFLTSYAYVLLKNPVTTC